jgi:hypothetical protein
MSFLLFGFWPRGKPVAKHDFVMVNGVQQLFINSGFRWLYTGKALASTQNRANSSKRTVDKRPGYKQKKCIRT